MEIWFLLASLDGYSITIMEASPLDVAYSLVKQADHAMMKGEYRASSDFYLKASAKFTEAMGLTASVEARRTMEAMAAVYKAKSQHLVDPKILSQVQKLNNSSGSITSSNTTNSTTSPPGSVNSMNRSRPDDLTMSLASARGIPSRNLRGKSTSEDHDPFYTFYSLINQAFTRAYNSALEKATASGTGLANSPDFVTDSFYVVPDDESSSTKEELLAEISNLRQILQKTSSQLHAYEMAVKAQKDITKAGLNQLKHDVKVKESTTQRQYDTEIEQLRSENDKLKIQNGRLKSRWDDLKQQARKKRVPEGEASS